MAEPDIVSTLLEFLFLSSFFAVVAMLFSLSRCIFFSFVSLSFAFFLNRNLIFGTCTLFVLFIIGILSSASSCYFRVNIFKSFFTVETSPTCSRIVSLSLKSILLVYVFPSCIFATAVHRFESCIPPLLHPRVWKTFQSFNFIMLEYRTKVLLKEKSLRD